MIRKSLLALAAAFTVAGTSIYAQDIIKIGAIAPKTGPLAGGAVVTQWPNVQLWVEQVNARGGLNVDGKKMQIELIEYDDKTNPGEHIKLAQRLATQDKVDFVVAPYGTGFNIATAPIYGKFGYPMIAVSAITDKAEELTSRYSNLFFAEAGFEIVYDKSYPLGTPDLSPVMKGAKDSGAKAFIAWSYPPDSFGLAEQAIIEDLDVNVYYSAVATSFPAFKGAYGNRINNVLGAGGTNVDDPVIAAYRKDHLDVTGKTADYWASANTYASLQILEQAIEGAATLDRNVVTQYIKDNSFDTVMGKLSFENQVSKTFWSVGQWQDGVFRGVKGSNVEGAVPVRAKNGWSE